ncbi:hypothetical protein [Streptomyces sp. NPDC045714]|uniref:hypothetical protein n=1 Tax=Streptomyces sp. NPDC045714 TaxID=3154913 RepID=UPI0033D28E72
MNYRGITFADDDNRFSPTVSTKGRTYLVEGDIKTWRARTLRHGVACPSRSSDGTRIAPRSRVRAGTGTRGDGTYRTSEPCVRLPVAETRSVDDQAAWLDTSTLAYALPGRAKGTSDIWTVPVGAPATGPSLLRAMPRHLPWPWRAADRWRPGPGASRAGADQLRSGSSRGTALT